MALDANLINAQDLVVVADYGQIYIWPYISARLDERDDDEDDSDPLAALFEAWESARFVGVLPRFIDLLTPGQYNFHTPLRLEVWSAEPPDDRDDWDHEVDADLDVPDGLLYISPPAAARPVDASIPAGIYRVRISGRGYTELGNAGANGDDSYRLRFWPRGQASAPILRKRWQGWDLYPLPDPPYLGGASPSPPHVDELPRPDGEVAEPDVTERPGVIVVVALDTAGRVLLLPSRLVGGALIELPACSLDQAEEDPLAVARRELSDQAGLRADTWNTLLDLPALPGETDESIRIYLARDLHPVPDNQRFQRRQNAGREQAQPRPTWAALDQAVDDVFADVIHNGVAAAAIIAAGQARDTYWGPLQPADLPWPSRDPGGQGDGRLP